MMRSVKNQTVEVERSQREMARRRRFWGLVRLGLLRVMEETMVRETMKERRQLNFWRMERDKS